MVGRYRSKRPHEAVRRRRARGADCGIVALGVRVGRRCYGSLFHGFLNTAGAIHAARDALSDLAGELALSFSAV